MAGIVAKTMHGKQRACLDYFGAGRAAQRRSRLTAKYENSVYMASKLAPHCASKRSYTLLHALTRSYTLLHALV